MLAPLQLDFDLRATVSAVAGEPRAPGRFNEIQMRNVLFRYVPKSSEAAFQIGPSISTLRPGELVFITGGQAVRKIDVTWSLLPRSADSR